jgi:predicted KAP-like P-loop ATPase
LKRRETKIILTHTKEIENMWADNETSEDLLGFKVHADLLVNIINDESVLPITIGVFGDWGSGKSSILQIVKEEFDKEDDEDSLCIYFNGWTFEGYDDAKAALLNSILKELEDNKKISAEIKETIKEKVKKLWKSVDWMRGRRYGYEKCCLTCCFRIFYWRN